MAFINFEIRHDGINVSDHVINYSRFQYICTGIGTIDITLENKNLGRTISPWDKMVLYEDGNKIGTYIVSSSIRSADGGTLTLQCQDYSKKVIDHFVTDQNVVIYATTTRYWIEKFLQESDVDYEFTAAGDGEIVGPNASYGLSSAYDLIIGLLQQSGWYIYFDQNGKAIVGELNRAGDHYDSVINENDIISIQRARNDARLRNRAVVWGAGDPVTGTWIGADISRNTPWNYDSDDKRAVVLANGMIYSTTVAEDLARKMLNEFAQIANEITVEIINHYGIDIGDLVYVRSKYFSGRMMVTTIESTGSKDGLIVKLTLNQKCPRLFAYFGILGEYIPVYIGTWGQGVWKKYTGGSTWTDNSSGLVENALYIIDLFVKNGILACVTNDGYLYIADITTNIWTKFEHGDLIDLGVNLFLEADIKAKCCSIDDTGNIIVGYQYNNEDTKRSWVLTISATGVLLKAEQIIPQIGAEYTEEVILMDLEAVGYPEEGIIESISTDGISTTSMLGTKTYQAFNSIDPDCYGVGPDASFRHPGGYISGGGSNFCAGYIIENDDTLWFLVFSGGLYRLLQYDLTTATSLNTYLISPPTIGRITVTGEKQINFLYKKSASVFDVVALDAIWDENYRVIGYHLYHYSYTLGNSTFTLITSTTMMGIDKEMFFERGALQGFTATWFFREVGITDTRIVGGYLYAYNLLDTTLILAPSGDITIGETATSGGYTNKFITPLQPFFVANSTGVYAGFLGFVMWRENYLYYKKTELWCFYNYVTPSGSYSPVPIQHNMRSFDMPGTGNVYPGIQYGGAIETPFYDGYTGGEIFTSYNYGASSTLTSLMLIEFNIWYIYRYTPELNYADNVVAIIKFPNASVSLESVFSFTESDGSFSDETGLHLSYNETYTQIWGGRCYHISGRVYTPCFVRIIQNKNTLAYYINIITSDLSSSLVDMSTLGYSIDTSKDYPPTAPGFYRDDHDGSVYMTIKPQSGGTGDTALYGFMTNGIVRKKITNWDQPAHIVKRYAISQAKIKWFVAPYSLGNTSLVLKHTSLPFEAGLIGASLDAQEQTYGVFEVIFEPENNVKVEISKGTPTVIYSTPLIDKYLDGVPHPYLAASLINNVDSFYLPPINNYVFYDGRVFDIPNTSGFTIASGVLPDSLLERYVALATSGEISLIKYDFTGQFYPLVMMSGLLGLMSGAGANPSGAITLFEATNYTLDPYMFVGVSGPPPLFFQRGSPYYPYWVNYSLTLPSSDMTIIRVDDFI